MHSYPHRPNPFLQTVIVIACITALALSTGCAVKRVSYPDLPHLDDPRKYLNNCIEKSRSIRQASGLLKMTIATPDGSQRAKNIFFAQAPRSLRFETLGFLNQPAMYFIADGTSLHLYYHGTNTYYTGRACPEAVASVIGVPVAPEDIVRLVLGAFPEINTAAARITVEQDRSFYYFDVSLKNEQFSVWVDPAHGRIVKYIYIPHNNPLYEISFSAFSDAFGRFGPQKVALSYYPGQVTIQAELQSVDYTDIEESVFAFTPPDTATRHRLSELSQ